MAEIIDFQTIREQRMSTFKPKYYRTRNIDNNGWDVRNPEGVFICFVGSITEADRVLNVLNELNKGLK